MLKKLVLTVPRLIGKQNLGFLFKSFSLFTRKFSYFAHYLQFKYDWKVPPQPEWFDHFCDQFYQFRKNKNPLWAERGVFGLLAIKPGADVLELCCGDGFNSYQFYSIRANKIIAVDFDIDAIPHAKSYNQAPNVEFRLCDIRYQMPEGKFDNITWDAAIEHFTPAEIDKLMTDFKLRLKPDGVISGYTIVENNTGEKQLSHHEYEFKNKEDLKRFFEPHFKNVVVFETIYPERHNLYFYASDSIIPFAQGWSGMTT